MKLCLAHRLLIVPEGIEIGVDEISRGFSQTLLIVPEGIEIFIFAI